MAKAAALFVAVCAAAALIAAALAAYCIHAIENI